VSRDVDLLDAIDFVLSDYVPTSELLGVVDRIEVLGEERDRLAMEHAILLTAVRDIAGRISPESKHRGWAAANGCDCVVCVAVAALKVVTP
jgi:hypothetical protein